MGPLGYAFSPFVHVPGPCVGFRPSHGFLDAVEEQCKEVHIHGLLAAFRIKAWAHANGFSISLGSVGTERFWRNLQRMARNKGRSRASNRSVHLLVLLRWIRLMQARFLRMTESPPGERSAAFRAQRLLANEKLSAALVGDFHAKAPLACSGSRSASLGALSESEIGKVYSVFLVGAL